MHVGSVTRASLHRTCQEINHYSRCRRAHGGSGPVKLSCCAVLLRICSELIDVFFASYNVELPRKEWAWKGKEYIRKAGTAEPDACQLLVHVFLRSEEDEGKESAFSLHTNRHNHQTLLSYSIALD